MAIKLQSLYEAINNQFDVILHTNSFYDKEVTWIHTVEQGEFSHLLHGDELIFNSGLNFTSQDWLKEFLKSLKDAHASGLIISVKSRPAFSQEIIDYCNEIQLPLFSTSWDTPFIDIMRIFSEILLKNEHRETSLAAALKNAIYYPENEDSYLNLSRLEAISSRSSACITALFLSISIYTISVASPCIIRLSPQ